MKTEKLCYVYGLRDPRNGTIKYVGQTINPQNRFKEHLCDNRRSYKSHWIASLKKQGLSPSLIILEETFNWRTVEQRWIKRLLKRKIQLTNATLGGEGTLGYIRPMNERQKISESLKRRFKEKGSPLKNKRWALNDPRRNRKAREKKPVCKKQVPERRKITPIVKDVTSRIRKALGVRRLCWRKLGDQTQSIDARQRIGKAKIGNKNRINWLIKEGKISSSIS